MEELKVSSPEQSYKEDIESITNDLIGAVKAVINTVQDLKYSLTKVWNQYTSNESIIRLYLLVVH